MGGIQESWGGKSVLYDTIIVLYTIHIYRIYVILYNEQIQTLKLNVNCGL